MDTSDARKYVNYRWKELNANPQVKVNIIMAELLQHCRFVTLDPVKGKPMVGFSISYSGVPVYNIV